MEKIIITSVIIALLFALAKYVEMKFIDKKMKPLKNVVRDTIIVLLCSITVQWVYGGFMGGKMSEFMNSITEAKILPTGATTEIFTGKPEF